MHALDVLVGNVEDNDTVVHRDYVEDEREEDVKEDVDLDSYMEGIEGDSLGTGMGEISDEEEDASLPMLSTSHLGYYLHWNGCCCFQRIVFLHPAEAVCSMALFSSMDFQPWMDRHFPLLL